MSGRRAAARWIMPLSASLALHAALFGLSPFAAPGAPADAVGGAYTRGVTVALRRFYAGPASEGAVGESAPKGVAVPKKDAAPVAVKAKRARESAGAKKAERALPAESRPAESRPVANAVTDKAGAVSGGGTVAESGVSGEGVSLRSPAGGGPAVTGAGAGKIFELSDLKVSRRVKPDYPVIARKRKEEGTVTLLITLEGERVSSVKVEKTSGFSTLDEAAMAAVRRWRFEFDKNAARVQARVPVTFKLK